MMKLKKNCDETQKVTKLKNSNVDQTQKLKLRQPFKKNQIVAKVKLWQNSNHDQTPTVIKLKTQIVTQLKNSTCDKTQYFKLWQNFNYEKSQFMMKKIL